MIYAVHILDGQYIKIGFCSGSVEARIATLQTGSPFKIEKLFVVDGSLRQEKHLHYLLAQALKDRGIGGMPPNEWYLGASPFLIGLLFNLRISVTRAFAYLEETPPMQKEIEARNRKREERFLKHNTNPEAVFKRIARTPKPVEPEWPKTVAQTKDKRREILLSLRDE